MEETKSGSNYFQPEVFYGRISSKIQISTMKKLLPWIGVGLLIRLVLMAGTFNPDIRGHNFAAYLISQKGEIFTFYDHISRLSRTDPLVSLYGDNIFIYPPLAYWTHAAFMTVLDPLYPWNTFNRLVADTGWLMREPQGLPQLLVLLKFPYLVVDAFGLWLILKLVSQKHQLKVGLMWIFNPITIYTAYMIGQFDIYIAVFLLATIWLWQNHRINLAAIVLSLAAGFKPFPLLLVPLLGEGLSQKVKLIFLSLLTYFLIISPYLSSLGFKQYALLANQTEKLWYAKIDISGGQYVPLFFMGLALLWWYNHFRFRSLPLEGWFGVVLLLFYSLVHYHVQWFVWITPVLILFAVLFKDTLLPLLVLFLCYILLVLFAEPSLNFGLFNSNSSFSLVKFIPFHLVLDQFLSLIRGIFAATSIILITQVHGQYYSHGSS